MDTGSGVFVAFYMYRAKYSYLAGFRTTDNGNSLQYSDLSHCLKFFSEREARGYLTENTNNPHSHFIVELTLTELLEFCPELYEIRPAS